MHTTTDSQAERAVVAGWFGAPGGGGARQSCQPLRGPGRACLHGCDRGRVRPPPPPPGAARSAAYAAVRRPRRPPPGDSARGPSALHVACSVTPNSPAGEPERRAWRTLHNAGRSAGAGWRGGGWRLAPGSANPTGAAWKLRHVAPQTKPGRSVAPGAGTPSNGHFGRGKARPAPPGMPHFGRKGRHVTWPSK